MAWPLTPLTTYLAGKLPPVKADDLNAIQNAINRAFAGTYSYAGLVLDGTGGNNAAPPAGGISASGPIVAGGAISSGGAIVAAGSITVGGSAIGRAAPTPTPQHGTLYSDSLVLAFGLFAQTGTLYFGMNISSCTKAATGIYTVTLLTGSASSQGYATIIPIVVPASNAAVGGAGGANSNNTLSITVFNSQRQPVDSDFGLVVVGG